MSSIFSSTLSESVAWRARCTGETRRDIVQQLRDESGPLMPAADTTLQQVLESGLLLAAGEAVNHVHHARGTSSGRVSVITEVKLFRDHIGLRIADEALPGLLAEVLPRQGDGEPYGVMGLRPYPARKHLDLVLREGRHRAWARLHGVPHRRWFQIRQALLDNQSPEVPFWASAGPVLDMAEAGFKRHRTLYPISLMSQILRRYQLWGPADWTDTRPVGHTIKVHWQQGPAAADIAAQLRDPICGIPGITAHPERCSDTLQRVVLELRDSQARDSQRSLARQRVSFTGEPHRVVATVLGRTGLGLDDCTHAQLEFRALLALYLFNAGSLSAVPTTRQASAITRYELIMSPRPDELVVLAQAPANVAWRLVGADTSTGVPGLRLLDTPTPDTWRLIHLPTGGRMTITRMDRDTATHVRSTPKPMVARLLTEADPLSTQETMELAGLLRRSGPMERVLAALVARMTTRDPDGAWAVGRWFHDPLRRQLPSRGYAPDSRRLWGTGDEWELCWEGYPAPADLVQSLTHPAAGLARARLELEGTRHYIEFFGARMRLEHRWAADPIASVNEVDR
ncbi:hypothetical protein [Kutzneria sp. CA-103260]|uniref:hypothetical protein n=1 Tax=Kutzneria sp. CA-103260 TaxID=2802641 RepID=UPI001BAE49C9|nr:hypothetical protein [Kutzneria sp. CA-103260]QUQ64608.1 hypothetical protein JJ691_23280 [Kutzneria sp. CA-103260]